MWLGVCSEMSPQMELWLCEKTTFINISCCFEGGPVSTLEGTTSFCVADMSFCIFAAVQRSCHYGALPCNRITGYGWWFMCTFLALPYFLFVCLSVYSFHSSVNACTFVTLSSSQCQRGFTSWHATRLLHQLNFSHC
ncbi:hypothetical protein TRVL_04902 [Trypanosoma vivax]|nr:hypothetical protein TRVL_04902 [Trypanosoma vivax]